MSENKEFQQLSHCEFGLSFMLMSGIRRCFIFNLKSTYEQNVIFVRSVATFKSYRRLVKDKRSHNDITFDSILICFLQHYYKWKQLF